MSAEEPEVAGICPACGWHSLFLGIGGLVLCNRAGACPAPDAAADLLTLRPSAIRLAEAAAGLIARRGAYAGGWEPRS